jgi:hypothetical protein
MFTVSGGLRRTFMLTLVFVIVGIMLGICQLYFPPQAIWRSNVARDRAGTFGVCVGLSRELSIMPLQFVTPTVIAFWSDGTWDHFLSQTSQPIPTDLNNERRLNQPFRTAA